MFSLVHKDIASHVKFNSVKNSVQFRLRDLSSSAHDSLRLYTGLPQSNALHSCMQQCSKQEH